MNFGVHLCVLIFLCDGYKNILGFNNFNFCERHRSRKEIFLVVFVLNLIVINLTGNFPRVGLHGPINIYSMHLPEDESSRYAALNQAIYWSLSAYV